MSASWAGVAASVRKAHAPARSVNTTSIPRPNVNASGAVQATRSSGRSRRVSLPKVLSIDSRSRWKWVVIFGTPVLPDVGPNSATSSAAVSAAAKSARLSGEHGGQVAGVVAAVAGDPQTRGSAFGDCEHVVGEPVVDQRDRRPGLGHDRS